jgi:hypothetical protein
VTPAETMAKIRDFAASKSMLERKIAEAARAIVPVLLDAGRVNSAKELQELFFQYDAKAQEMTDLFKADPSAAIGAVMSWPRAGSDGEA